MKRRDIPQDVDANYMGKYRLRYGRDDDGKVVPVKSSGWKVEYEATQCAWDEINENLVETYQKVKEGKLRPLAYYIELKLLTPRLLAQNLGINPIKVWWHLRERPFFNPCQKTLQNYANYLEISMDEILKLPEERPCK